MGEGAIDNVKMCPKVLSRISKCVEEMMSVTIGLCSA